MASASQTAKKTARASGGAPALHFAIGGDHKGFSAADVAHNRNTYAAVRELVQNSLDASGDHPAKIQFVVETVKKAEIPAIAEYEQAFQSACAWMEKANLLHGQNRNIANVIEKELRREEIPMLYVLDNGVGLEKKSMVSLLGSGAGTKVGNTAGSYGVGHLAAFCLSRMNYMLYGGLNGGRKICAGHAQLASHPDSKGTARDKDGYYVVDMRPDLFAPYIFAEGGQVPDLLNRKLDAIRKEFKSGSVVAITAFNFFGDSPREMPASIQSIVAENFYPAVDSGRLTVEIINGEGEKFHVNAEELAGIITRKQDKVQAVARNFPAGRRVAESYNTLKNGKVFKIPFEDEQVLIRVRENAQYKTNVVICRKGMWITDSYSPMCSNAHYSDRVQFDALLLIDSSTPNVHEAVRGAEGPYHNELDPKQYMEGEPEKVATLRKFSAAVREFLNTNVKEIDSDPWGVPGFLTVKSGKSIGESLRNAYAGEGVVITGGRNTVGPPPGPNPNPTAKPGKPFPVRVASYWEPGARTVQLVAETDHVCKDVELRLGVDGGADEACAHPLWDNLFLCRAEMNGKKLRLLQRGGKAVGAFLGELPANKQVLINVEFEGEDVPEKLAIFCDFRQSVPPGENAASAGESD